MDIWSKLKLLTKQSLQILYHYFTRSHDHQTHGNTQSRKCYKQNKKVTVVCRIVGLDEKLYLKKTASARTISNTA